MEREIVIKIETTADILMLRPLNMLLRGLLEQHPAFNDAEEWIDNLELAFNEAFANIHDHAYRGREPGPLTAVLRIDTTQLEIRLEDRGSPFDPDKVRPPNFDKPGERGLGVWLIGQYLDEVTYNSAPDGRNTLILVKRLPPQK